MAQSLVDLTKLKDRDTAAAIDTIGNILEDGGVAADGSNTSIVVGAAARKVTLATAANLVTAVLTGTDTNIGLVVTPKGSGVVALSGSTTANSSVQVPMVTSSVNWVQLTGAVANGNPIISAGGTDTDIGLSIRPKGTDPVAIGGTSLANASFLAATVTSAVNSIQAVGAVTGSPAQLKVGGSGSDANAGLLLTANGTGVVALGGTTVANSSVQVPIVTTSVNFVEMSGAVANSDPIIAGTGTDTHVGLNLRPKGTDLVSLGGTGQANASFLAGTVTSAVNAVQAVGAVTGSPAQLKVGGTSADANIGLLLTANGTGAVTMGSPLARTVSTTLTAVGTTRTDALALTKDFNIITSAGAGTGVILPVGIIGMSVFIENAGANAIQVYAAGSETVDTVAGSTGVVLTNAKRCMYYFVAANTWISAQLGVVSA